MVCDMIAGFLQQTSEDIWFVCEEQGQIISFGFCEPERMTNGTWNLLAIGVEPSSQAKGIGTQMMDYLEDKLAAQGACVLLVETTALDEQEKTREFYRKIGYVQEARIREFFEADTDKIVFWKHF